MRPRFDCMVAVDTGAGGTVKPLAVDISDARQAEADPSWAGRRVTTSRPSPSPAPSTGT